MSTRDRRRRTALWTVASHLEARNHDVKLTVALYLALQPVKEVAFELNYLPAPQASHVDMVTLRASFVEVLLALQVHKIQFIDQPVPFEQIERAIDGYAINSGINFSGLPKNLTCIQVLFGGLDDTQNRLPLMRHAQSPGHKFGLKPARSFGLR